MQQMLQYKEKVAEANANYIKSEQYKEEVCFHAIKVLQDEFFNLEGFLFSVFRHR